MVVTNGERIIAVGNYKFCCVCVLCAVCMFCVVDAKRELVVNVLILMRPSPLIVISAV